MTLGKPDPERGARFLEKLLNEDPAYLDVADDEEIERQMDAAGIEVKSVPSAEELMALAARKAEEQTHGPLSPLATTSAPAEKRKATASTPPVKRPRPAAIAAAVALGALGVAALANRGVIEAYLARTEPIGPDTTWTAHEKAWAIRAEAIAACDVRRWVECTQKLDEAMKLDPAGESNPRVVAARRAIADGMPVPPEEEDTPPKPRLK